MNKSKLIQNIRKTQQACLMPTIINRSSVHSILGDEECVLGSVEGNCRKVTGKYGEQGVITVVFNDKSYTYFAKAHIATILIKLQDEGKLEACVACIVEDGPDRCIFTISDETQEIVFIHVLSRTNMKDCNVAVGINYK